MIRISKEYRYIVTFVMSVVFIMVGIPYCGGASYVQAADTSVCVKEIDVTDYQTEHPYANGINQTWTISEPGATQITIEFSSDTRTQYLQDTIAIYDANNKLYNNEYFSGTTLAGKKISLLGDSVKIVFKSRDSEISNTYYGFSLASASADFLEHVYDLVSVNNGVEKYECTRCNDSYEVYPDKCKRTIDVSEYHSDHPIVGCKRNNWTINVPGASSIILNFNENCELSYIYDCLDVWDADNKLIMTTSDYTELAGLKLEVPGNTAIISYVGNSDDDYWGFAIDSAYANLKEHNHEITYSVPAECEKGGYDICKCANCGVVTKRNIIGPLGHGNIVFEKNEISVGVGESCQLNASLDQIKCDDVITYESSDPDIATVDSEGNVSAVAKGNAVITATTLHSTAECTVKVIVLPTRVSLNHTKLSMVMGESAQLTAEISPEDATSDITWSSSNANVATVSKTGVVQAVGAGTATISVATDNGLTAQCEVEVEPAKYNICFNGNGATAGEMNTMESCIYNNEYSLPVNTFSRNYYTFEGWNTAQDGTGTAFSDMDSVKALSAVNGTTVNLYAMWKPIEYTISYYYYGGTDTDSNPKTYTSETGRIVLDSPSMKGFSFDGWYSDSSYTQKVSAIEKGTGGNLTLHAKWTAIKYPITYQLNGGNIGNENPVNYTVNTDTIILKNPTKSGCVFEGWYLDSAYTRKCTVIEKGTTGAISLYAKWKPNKYKIKFVANTTFVSGNMEDMVCNYGQKYRLTPMQWTNTAYKFLGWNTKADGTGTAYANNAEISNLTAADNGTITLYAQWKMSKKPVVTLKKNSIKSNKISWAKVDGAVKYEVYKSTTAKGKYTKIKTTTSTSYIDKKATTKKKYYYKVRAIGQDANGKILYGDYSNAKSITTAEKPKFTARIITKNGWSNVIHISITNKAKKPIIVKGELGMYTFMKGWQSTMGPVWPKYHVYRADRLFGAAKLKEMSGQNVTIKAKRSGSAYISLKTKDRVNRKGHACLMITYDDVDYYVFIYNSGKVVYVQDN